MTTGRLQATIKEYRRRLLAHERTTMAALDYSHRQTLAAIEPQLNALYDKMSAAIANGEDVSKSWLYEANRLQLIERYIEDQINAFSATAEVLTNNLQHAGAQLGMNAGMDSLNALLPNGVNFTFGMPSSLAIYSMVGATQAGSPLHDLFSGFGKEASQGAKTALITGVTLGYNPRQIAPMVQDALNISRYRALTISRTEMLRSYRDANLQTFQANDDVVNGWIWQAALDRSTCAACIAMNGTEHSMDEDMDSHPNCFPAGTIVSGPCVVGSTTRWFNGEIIDIEMDSGNFLSVTPNHPILAPEGWVAAGLLHVGSYVFRCFDAERTIADINPNDYQVPSLIEQVATAFRGTGRMIARSVPTSPKDFHGDGAGSNIHVVRAYSALHDVGDVKFVSKPVSKQLLSGRYAQLAILARLGPLYLFFKRMLAASYSLLSSFDILATFFRRAIFHHEAISGSLISQGDTGLLQSQFDHVTRNTERESDTILRLTREITGCYLIGRQHQGAGGAYLSALDNASLLSRSEQSALSQDSDKTGLASVETLRSIFGTLAGNIGIDRILKIKRRSFSGHVYNLQTVNNWYIANNIITHNCRCVMVPKTKSWDDILSPLGIDSSGIEDTSVQIESGSDWFNRQDEATQRDILGNAKYEAFKNGDFTLDDIVGRSHDKDWGSSIYERSLKDTLEAARKEGIAELPKEPELKLLAGTIEERERYLIEHGGDAWQQSLSPDEKAAVNGYTNMDTNMYIEMNNQLRGNGYADFETMKAIHYCQDALLKSSAPVDMIVHRGYGDEQSLLEKFQEAAKTGGYFQEKGFASTTIKPGGDIAYEEGFVVNIHVFKGAPGAYIAPLSDSPAEREWLIPHGAMFQVVGVEQVNGKWVFEIEYRGLD